jgi:hypothetical protein
MNEPANEPAAESDLHAAANRAGRDRDVPDQPHSLLDWLRSLQEQGVPLKGGKLTVTLPPRADPSKASPAHTNNPQRSVSAPTPPMASDLNDEPDLDPPHDEASLIDPSLLQHEDLMWRDNPLGLLFAGPLAPWDVDSSVAWEHYPGIDWGDLNRTLSGLEVQQGALVPKWWNEGLQAFLEAMLEYSDGWDSPPNIDRGWSREDRQRSVVRALLSIMYERLP